MADGEEPDHRRRGDPGPGSGRGFRLTGIKLTLRGQVDGLDEGAFQEAANAAKSGCPISKALAAVTITLDAALA